MTTHTEPKASALDTIGETPLVELDSRDGVSIYAKLETFNPGGSVEDRIGKPILERMLDRGDVPPGGTVVEPTAGNTGIGMAIAANQFGLDAVFVVPEGFSTEKERLMAALGGEIVHVSGSTFGELLGEQREEGDYRIEGIGTHDPSVTELLEPGETDEFVTVTDRDAHAEVRRLAAAESLLAGSSSGAASVAARRVSEDIARGALDVPHDTVVTVFPDGGERYLSKRLYGRFEQWGANP